jgi:hypothetical protein
LRGHGWPLIGAAVPKTKSRGFEIDFLPDQGLVEFGEGGGTIEVLRTSCSFLYTHHQVYESIYQQLNMQLCNQQMSHGLGFLPFFQPMVSKETTPPRYLADDFAFTERARQCGIPIRIDTTIRIGHVWAYPYMWEDLGTARTFHNSFRWDPQANSSAT